MNYNNLLKGILDIGEELLKSGAETARVEDSLYRIVRSYGFINPHIWVIDTNIQTTVETKDGEIITQIRNIYAMDTNFDRLDYLNNLSRQVCRTTPDPETLKKELNVVLSRPTQSVWLQYLAGIMSVSGFGIFFNCDFEDTIVAVLVSIIMVFIGRRLSKIEANPLVYNFIISCIFETIVIIFVNLGLGHHIGYITVGAVMLLISGIGATNGIRDLLHRDTLSGIIELWNAILGAAGIAAGITLPMLVLRGAATRAYTVLAPNVLIQLFGCTVGCLGFAYLFKIKGTQVVYSGIGAFFTWVTYLIVFDITAGVYVSIFVASIFVAFYAHIMARINRAPTTIFLTASAFPLIPGARLYCMMYAIVMRQSDVAITEGVSLIASCLAIALGFILVDILNKYISLLLNKRIRV